MSSTFRHDSNGESGAKERSLTFRFATGAAWSFLGTGLSQALGLLASLVTARLLGRVGFGEIGMIQSTVGMLGVFSGLGLGLTATNYIAAFRQTAPCRAENVIALSMSLASLSGILMTTLLICGATQAASSIKAPQLTFALILASPLLLLGAIGGVQTGVLAGLESFGEIAKVNVARGLASFPLAVLGVKFGGRDGAVAAMLASAALGVAISEVAVRRQCTKNGIQFRWHGGWREHRIIASFSLPAFLSAATAGPAMWLANTLLVRQHDGYSQLGLLNAANQWRTIALFLPATVLQVALPLLSSSRHDPSHASQFSRIFEATQTLTVAVVFPLAALLMFFSDVIVRLYGVSFLSGGPALRAVAFTTCIMAIGAATGPAIQAKNRMWLAFGINSSCGAITVAFVWLTASPAGALSLAYGTALGYLLTTVWAFQYLRAELPKHMLTRVYQAIALSMSLLLIASALPQKARVLLALPIMVLVVVITFSRLVAESVRHRLLGNVRSLLTSRHLRSMAI